MLWVALFDRSNTCKRQTWMCVSDQGRHESTCLASQSGFLAGLAWGTKVFQDLHVLCLAIALVRHYKRPKIVTDAKPHITKMRPDLITVLALLETESYNHHEESPDQH